MIIRGAEAGGYSAATLHLGFLALCPTAAPPGCVGMVIVSGGGASSQHWKLLSSKRYCAWCTSSQAAPCYSQSDLMCELTGCSQQPWQGWNRPPFPDEAVTCLKSVSPWGESCAVLFCPARKPAASESRRHRNSRWSVGRGAGSLPLGSPLTSQVCVHLSCDSGPACLG